MKKMFMLYLSLFGSVVAHACDVCGCSASAQIPGILPLINKNLVGIGYQQNSFRSMAHHVGEGSSKESFHTLQLWGRINLLPRLQFLAAAPYRMNRRMNNGKEEVVNGLGDLSARLGYFWINDNHKVKTWRHALQTQIGLKAPTGQYNKVVEGLMLHPNIQAGTGSFDMLAAAQYTLRYKGWGATADAQYTLNGTNKQHVHFGNRLHYGLRGFFWIQKKDWRILPQVGLLAEHAEKDKQQQTIQEVTGGQIYLAQSALDIYFKQLGLSCSWQIPVQQNLGDGHVQSSSRLQINFIYSF